MTSSKFDSSELTRPVILSSVWLGLCFPGALTVRELLKMLFKNILPLYNWNKFSLLRRFRNRLAKKHDALDAEGKENG